jgi:hypothetical protein
LAVSIEQVLNFTLARWLARSPWHERFLFDDVMPAMGVQAKVALATRAMSAVKPVARWEVIRGQFAEFFRVRNALAHGYLLSAGATDEHTGYQVHRRGGSAIVHYSLDDLRRVIADGEKLEERVGEYQRVLLVDRLPESALVDPAYARELGR